MRTEQIELNHLIDIVLIDHQRGCILHKWEDSRVETETESGDEPKALVLKDILQICNLEVLTVIALRRGMWQLLVKLEVHHAEYHEC